MDLGPKTTSYGGHTVARHVIGELLQQAMHALCVVAMPELVPYLQLLSGHAPASLMRGMETPSSVAPLCSPSPSPRHLALFLLASVDVPTMAARGSCKP